MNNPNPEHLRQRALMEKQRKERELSHNTKVSNSPNPQGTVTELAAMLGCSKSKIRELRRNNQLEAVLATHKTK